MKNPHKKPAEEVLNHLKWLSTNDSAKFCELVLLCRSGTPDEIQARLEKEGLPRNTPEVVLKTVVGNGIELAFRDDHAE